MWENKGILLILIKGNIIFKPVQKLNLVYLRFMLVKKYEVIIEKKLFGGLKIENPCHEKIYSTHRIISPKDFKFGGHHKKLK